MEVYDVCIYIIYVISSYSQDLLILLARWASWFQDILFGFFLFALKFGQDNHHLAGYKSELYKHALVNLPSSKATHDMFILSSFRAVSP